jgi:hypothetical protein
VYMGPDNDEDIKNSRPGSVDFLDPNKHIQIDIEQEGQHVLSILIHAWAQSGKVLVSTRLLTGPNTIAHCV